MKYGYINKFTAQPNKRGELVDLLLQAARALEANGDCWQYIVGTATEPDVVFVTEIWASRQAHDSSLELPDVQAIIAKAMPFIAGVTNVAEQEIAGGKNQ